MSYPVYMTIYAEKIALEAIYKNRPIQAGLLKARVSVDSITLATIATSESNYTGYARQNVTFGDVYQTVYGTTISNTNQVVFPAFDVADLPIQGFFLTDGTDVLHVFNYANPVSSIVGRSMKIDIGAVQIGLD